jgi:hypothetical protein
MARSDFRAKRTAGEDAKEGLMAVAHDLQLSGIVLVSET